MSEYYAWRYNASWLIASSIVARALGPAYHCSRYEVYDEEPLARSAFTVWPNPQCSGVGKNGLEAIWARHYANTAARGAAAEALVFIE